MIPHPDCTTKLGTVPGCSPSAWAGGGRSHPELSSRSSGSAPGPAPSPPVSEPEPAAPGWQAGGCSAQPCSVCAHLWAQRV